MRSGEVLDGRFVLEQLTGAGGMGEVHRALDQTSGEHVAVKILYRRGIKDLLRFEREAKCLAALDHPGIVRYLGHAVDAQQAYLVMEWLEGENLAARLARSHLTLAEAVSLAARVAEGLAAAHAAGVVHRDLKPSNLFLVDGELEKVKIIDFGLARRDATDAPVTASGATLGTPGYMAPEQAKTPRDVDARADVFSLGCILFHGVTARPPYEQTDPLAMLIAASTLDAPRARSVVEGVPEALDDLIARMLSRDPEKRPTDVVKELRAVEADIKARRLGWSVPTAKLVPSAAPGTPKAARAPSDALRLRTVSAAGSDDTAYVSPLPGGVSVDPRASTASSDPPRSPSVASDAAGAQAQPPGAHAASGPPAVSAAPARAGMHPATAALITIVAVVALLGACGSGCLYCACLAPASRKAPAPKTTSGAAHDAGVKDAGHVPVRVPTRVNPK